MKKHNIIFFLVVLVITNFLSFAQTQNVGIGTNAPNASAILHLDVSDNTAYPTKRGLLIPVMDASQRNGILTPAKGLLVYVTDDNNFYFNSGTPTSPIWTVILSSLGNLSFANISSDTNITAAMLVGTGASLAPTGTGTITANKFVIDGTTDAVDLATNETAGILPIAKGGTGLGTAPTNGQLLIGNGTGYSLGTLTPGTGINIVDAAGSITISAIASAIDHNALLNVELASPTVTYGHISNGIQTIAGIKTFSSQLKSTVTGVPPFEVASSDLVSNLNADLLDGKHAIDFINVGAASSGDLSGNYPGPITVVGIQGKSVVSTSPVLGQILRYDGTKWDLFGSDGIVASVTLNLPTNEFNITQTFISNNVDITATWVNQNQNLVFASPNGSSGTPSFRQLIDDDIPNNITITNLSGTNTGDVTLDGTLNYLTITNQVITRNAIDLATDVTGILPIANGGTGLGTTPTVGQILIGNGTDYSLKTLTQGTGISISSDANTVTIATTVSGTVTSVGLALPSEFSVTNSPVTGTGTLTGAWVDQSANKVFAGPAVSGVAAPTFRSLVENDLPSIDVIKLTGVLPVVKGGTGASSLTGMVYGDGTNALQGLSKTPGYVTYWDADGKITGDDNFTWNPTTPKLFIDGDLEVTGIIDPKAVIYEPQNSAPTAVEGALYYDAATDKLKIITGSGTETLLTGLSGAAGGDLSGTYPNPTIAQKSATSGQVLKWDGDSWEAADDIGSAETDPVVKAITGIVKSNGTTISAAVAGTDYLVPNTAITGATHTKITYDTKGLITSGADLDATDIPNLDASKLVSGILPVARGGTGASTLTGMLKGNGTSAISAVNGTTAGNLAFWSDVNTIADDNDLNWNSTTNKLSITGSLEASANVKQLTSTLTPTTEPASPVEGMLYYNNAENAVKVYDGTSWNNLATSNMVVMSAYLSSNQNLNNNNWTKLIFNSIEFESHSNSYNIITGEFTAPVTGYYQINANGKATMTAADSYYLEISIYKNGSSYSEGSIGRGNNTDNRASSNICSLIELTLGQKITIFVNAHFTGTPQAIGSATTPYVTYLTIHQVK